MGVLIGRDRSGDVRYVDPIYGLRSRPALPMPLEAHRQCGRLLQLVGWATEGRKGAHGRVSFVRHTLGDFASREFDAEDLDNPGLEEIYSSGPRPKSAGNVDRTFLIECLEQVKAILQKHYPHCRALSALVEDLDAAIASIAQWDGKPRGKVYREPDERRGFRSRRLQA